MPKQTLFQKLYDQYKTANKGDSSVETALKWCYKEVKTVYGTQYMPFRVAGEGQTMIAPEDMGWGRMYLYEYRAKNAEEYFDRFPLVLPFTVKSDHIVGFNLHYLPERYRLLAMNKILHRANPIFPPKKKDWSKLDYDAAVGTSVDFMRVAVRQYSLRRIRTACIDIDPKDWITAAFLPTAQFRGSINTVGKMAKEMLEKIKELKENP